ncbi:MAG TPA: response regulator [Xanthomonadales bacterium]|nr:response regulator [Xanthomonadales bacterium]
MPKILIVDDSPAQLYSLKRIVEKGGLETVTAESGEMALQLATSEMPSVILMDVVMPGMSGYQATRKLTRDEITCNIPVIFVTSKSQESDKVWGMRQGASNYITKPVNPNHLLSAIREVMAA